MSSSEVYQVIDNYEIVETGEHEYLIASKGDIIVDCEVVDENWFRAKNIRSGKYGLIPKVNISVVSSNEYSELEPELVEKLQEEGVNVPSSKKLFDASNDGLLSTEIKNCLSKFAEYVDMSSEETLNAIDEASVQLCESKNQELSVNKNPTNPIPKPPRGHQEPTACRGSDEGYNSGSHYSGENAESSNIPLLHLDRMSKTDEAGYEVPSVDVGDEADVPASKPKKKKKSLVSLWRGKSETETKLTEKSSHDEIRENYYAPPPQGKEDMTYSGTNSTMRVVLSLIGALGLSITVFLILLLLAKLHPILCFSISLVLFMVAFVVPVTLFHRGFLCVFALLLPSLAAKRSKIVVMILIVRLFILGPIFGIADKMYIAKECSRNAAKWFNTSVDSGQRATPTNTVLKNFCWNEFQRNQIACFKSYQALQLECLRVTSKSDSDQTLCKLPEESFCLSKGSLRSKCFIPAIGINKNETGIKFKRIGQKNLKGLQITRTFRKILLYMLPLLLLLILSEAYNYNKLYLTTKNTDNIYITQRLKELDCERKNRGLTDLILPLTRIEFQTYLVRGNWKVTKDERKRIIRSLFVLLVAVFGTVVLILLEDYIHWLLLETLNGNCLGFYKYHANVLCRHMIYSLLGGFFFIVCVQSHLLRLRSVICDYTYPEMVEIRSKHLYYKILHDRHTFARHVRRKIQLLSEEKRLRMRVSFSSKVYAVLPSTFQWMLSKFVVIRCMICDSLAFTKIVECENSICRADYCFECHVDAGQCCLTCKPAATHNSPNPRSSFSV